MRQLAYTMFINNNHASFHLWLKENLFKHQRVSKYYESDCGFKIKLAPLVISGLGGGLKEILKEL